MTSILENTMHALSHFKLAKFEAVYKVGTQGLHLPQYKGATFRGVFGHVFREVACACPKDNKGGVENHFPYCAYAYIFETSAPEGSELLHSYDSIPRPFILEPPDHQKTFYAPGERFTLGFTLFGKGIEYLPYFIYVLEAMGKKGFGKGRSPAQLRQIFSIEGKGDWTDTIYEESNKRIKDEYTILSGKDLIAATLPHQISKGTEIEQQMITLYFTSPTRMKYEKHYVSDPQFHVILRNVVRRITALLYFYHDERKVDMNFASFFEEAKNVMLVQSETEWVDWDRYSSRQNERLKMGGIIGKAIYEGDISAYMPWLLLGEWTNIGKNPVFGLGKIKVGI